jgi:membrane protease YdiL (CAAX protease family)
MVAPMVAGLVPSDSMFLLVAAYSASLAGVILTAIVSGKAGLREMFRRLLIWRAGIGWWAFALFAFALMYLGGLVLAALFSGSTLKLNLTQPLYMIIPMIILQFFFDSGLGEELGWRGFLLPRLQARYSALVSSIIVGIVWGLWHLPLFMLEGMSPTYEMGQAFGIVPALLGYTVFVVVPYAILFTWVYNNTKGSLLLAFVFHASQAWFALLMDPDNLIGPYLGFTAILTVTAVVVVLTSGAENLSRKNERIMLQDL